MARTRFIYAVLLAGVLSYPLVVQPLHILNHHGHEGHQEHTVHQINEDHCHHACNYDPQKEPVGGDLILASDHGECFVCEFEFPANDLPLEQEALTAALNFGDRIQAPLISRMLASERSDSHPRAPPVVS